MTIGELFLFFLSFLTYAIGCIAVCWCVVKACQGVLHWFVSRDDHNDEEF